MKFWQKIFLWTLVIFILAFDAGAYALTTYSYNFNRQRERENGIREQSIILSSITSRISNAETIYVDASNNEDRLIAILQPLTDYYKPQGVLLALFDGETEVYSDIEDIDQQLLLLESIQNKNIMDGLSGGKRYIFVASLIPDYPHLTLVYARNISQIDDFRKDISRVFVILNIVVIFFMGIVFYLLLKYMTRPIDELNRITTEIAGGAYNKRVVLNRTDEFGNLGNNFNLMADSVEKNMERLTKTAEDRQQFIDDLSHEMKTPITSILGYTEYLQNARSTEEDRETAVCHLHDAALRLKNLSGKLMELAYLRGEKIELQNVNIPDLLSALTDMTRPIFTNRQLTLNTQTTITEINGDETLLLSMLTNLVENAAKASKSRSTITVKAYKTNYPVIEVSDTGQGMEQREIHKITAPFYRVDKSRSRKFGGVGLGLSIVSQIVTLHGARLEIDSIPGVGTTVRIHFITL